jgi:hypothetical protein
MENEIINDSEFCACNGEGEQFEVIKKEPILYDPYETGEYKPYTSEHEPPREMPAVICSICRKSIKKRVLYLQGVRSVYKDGRFESNEYKKQNRKTRK